MAVQDTSSQQQSGDTKSNTTRSLGSILSGAFNSVGSGLRSVNSWMGNDSFLGEGITNGALANAGIGVLNMGVNMLAGQNQTGIGNAMQTIGGLASNIPGVGGLIGAGVGVVGGLVNAAFGSHINEEFVNQTRNQANQIGSNVFNANTNADLLNDWGNLTEQSSVRKSEVGSDGWFSSKASRKTAELNRQIAEANRRQLANFNVAAENVDTQNDFRIMQNMAAYGGPIGSFRRFYANGGSLFDTPEFFTFEPQTYDKGGYLNQAKALIRENEGWSAKPYADSPKGKNWRSVGYGFNDSGFRDKYPEGISKHYEHGITKKQAEEELDYFLNKAEKQLKSIYGKQWDDFSDSQKAAILDTYYQRPASVGKSSRFYKAVTAGEEAGRYLGVAGYSKRNNIRQSVFGGAGFSSGAYEDDSEYLSYPSPILEATSPISELDLSGIEPTKVINPEINLSYPSLDLNFLTSSQKPVQQQVPIVGTVEDFLASYGDFEQNLFSSRLNNEDMNIFDFGGGLTHGADFDTGINWVEEGGSHGQNPLGGVPMGVDESGVPNLVEEDEAIWNGDYVFSRRMKVPKKLREKYNLSDDATFADAVKKLTKESEERPLDIISRNTQDHILGELADSQEEIRMAKAQRKMEKEQQLQEDFLTGVQFGLGGSLFEDGGFMTEAEMDKAAKNAFVNKVTWNDNIPWTMKMDAAVGKEAFNEMYGNILNGSFFADGGGIHIDPSKRGTFKAQASKMGMGVQEAASHILANKENYSPAMVKKAVFAHNFAHADGGNLFTNPFAYGGAMGTIFAGEGDRPNTLNLDAANQSLVRRIFGDTGFTRFMENTSAALNDPLGYFAGDEINAVIDKLGKMSEPQLERFFRTDIGRAIAPYLAGDDNSQIQEAGMRGAKSVANIVRRVQRPVQIAAKKAMAQSRQAARGQMRTPKGGGSQKVLNETMTPTQAARQATTGSTEGLPQGWNFTRGNTSTVTNTSGVTGRLNPKSPTGRAAQSRGITPDPYAGLEGTLNMRAPIGSGNFGYLPWALGAAGVGGAGYGLYKGLDWLAEGLTNPDGTISGVNDPATQATINSLPSEATSNRGNGNKGKAAVTETPAITPEETGATSTRRGSQDTNRGRGNGSGTVTKNRGSVVPFTYDWYRNGSDGYSKPWGFTVGQNGLIDKNTGYTDDYRNLVSTLGAKDIKEWAKNHADDPSLRSFLDNNYKGKNYVEKLNAFVNDDKFTDDMWRRGATDGKYGFMHHVANEIGKDQLPEFKAPSITEMAGTVPEDTSLPEQGLLVFDPKIMGNPKAMAAGTRSTITDPNGTKVTRVTGDGTSDNGLQRSPFKPKQTWTRYAPIAMNALFGLKEMLTPADYGNADAIMAAAYQAGSPVSIGTEYIGDYRKRDPFDETYLMNIINQNSRAANRNFMNISGGNRAAAMSGILANDLVTQRSLAEAARQAYLANRTDDAQVAEFNRGTNIFNAQAQNQRNQFLAQLNSQRQNAMLSGIAQGARLRQAIKDQRDAAISANLTAFAQGLGDLGKENGYYNMLGGLNEEGVLKYFYGDDWKTKFNNVNG